MKDEIKPYIEEALKDNLKHVAEERLKEVEEAEEIHFGTIESLQKLAKGGSFKKQVLKRFTLIEARMTDLEKMFFNLIKKEENTNG